MKGLRLTKLLRPFGVLAFVLLLQGAYSQDVERELPAEWEGLVEGARFRDLFLPLKGEKLVPNVWGADGVLPRFVDNGIEDDTFSYWGGNIIEENGVYHLFVCAWLENTPKGHMSWPRSMIFRCVSQNLHGPYKNIEMIGFGHNPEIYKAKNGEYIIAAHTNWKPYRYRAKAIDGKWKMEPFAFDKRGRDIIEGMSNLSFAVREDGSVLMVCRGGGIWISKDGIEDFKQVSTQSVYPKREGKFEDPVIWRDEQQYHLIVNDWLGRIAYYLRSANGIDWVEDAGEAYTPGIAFHENGRREDWYKFERIKIFQDEHKRAVQANFAVCDTLKKLDLGNDKHSSKNIAIPLRKSVLMEIVDRQLKSSQKEITLKIRAEQGFDPQTDIDLESLRFGRARDVNFDKACKLKKVKRDAKDLIVVFDTKNYEISNEDFVLKLMGRLNKGDLLFGYVRNPERDFQEAILSCRKPQQKGAKFAVEVENFGFKDSKAAKLRVFIDNKMIGEKQIEQTAPYQTTELYFENYDLPSSGLYRLEIWDTESDKLLREESFKLDNK